MRAMATPDPNTAERVELPDPEPAAGEVLVRVVCSAVNPADTKVVGGEFAGRLLHARTDPRVVGYDVSGTVEGVGAGVDGLAKGDRVWGHLPYSSSNRQGAFAELVTMKADEVAVLPDAVEHHVAAAAATVGLSALQGLRDKGGLGQGGRVLVIGAGGGVGALAVSAAKRLDAAVVGVCSTRDVERVRALGADEVIDRKKDDPLRGDAQYDVVYDTPAVHSYGRCVHLLRPGGGYVTTLPSPGLIVGMVRAMFSSRTCSMLVVASRRDDLRQLGAWLADGMEVAIDSRHPVREVKKALQRMDDRERSGRVVVDVADGW